MGNCLKSKETSIRKEKYDHHSGNVSPNNQNQESRQEVEEDE